MAQVNPGGRAPDNHTARRSPPPSAAPPPSRHPLLLPTRHIRLRGGALARAAALDGVWEGCHGGR